MYRVFQVTVYEVRMTVTSGIEGGEEKDLT